MESAVPAVNAVVRIIRSILAAWDEVRAGTISSTGPSQIVGMVIVETTSVNSVLTVRNPAGNAAALTITPLAGGTRPVSAHLVITRLQ